MSSFSSVMSTHDRCIEKASLPMAARRILVRTVSTATNLPWHVLAMLSNRTLLRSPDTTF
jgi:hypothetical protein